MVRDVLRVVDFARFDELVTRANLLGDGDGLFALERGQAGAHRGHPDGAVAEGLMGDGENERAIDPAGVTNEHRPEARKVIAKKG